MLRQFYLCAALLAASLCTYAQEKKNFVMLSSGFFIDDQDNADGNTVKTRSFDINAGYGRYIKPSLALGIKAGYTTYKQEKNLPEQEQYKNWNTSFTPFIRHQLPLWQTKFSIYNEAGISGGFGKSTYETASNDINRTFANAYYEPGLMFGINKCVLLQASLGSLFHFNYSLEKGDNEAFKRTTTSGGLSSTYNFNNLRVAVNYLF